MTVVYPYPRPKPNPSLSETPKSGGEEIEAACKKAYDPMLPCNFYVAHVKSNLPTRFSSVELPTGQADAMVESFEKTWTTLENADEAMSQAAKGVLVVVGLHTSRAALNKVRSSIGGTVKISPNSSTITVVADNKEQRDYRIPAGASVKVKGGDRVKPGDVLLMAKPTHGHVAIIVAGTVDNGPKCYSTNEAKKGKYDGKSKGDKPLFGWVFKREDEGHVKYFTPPQTSAGPKQ
jgi:biotin carboxyl carrier protein